jgi:hypothetical protein
MRKYFSAMVLTVTLLIYGVLAKYFDEELLGGIAVVIGCLAYFYFLSRQRKALSFEVIRESEQEFVLQGPAGRFVFNRPRATVSRLNHLLTTFPRIRRLRVTRTYDEGHLLSFEYGVHLVLENSEITLGSIWKEAEALHFANRLADWLGRDVEMGW